jgi:glutamine amidotransferase PdxT
MAAHANAPSGAAQPIRVGVLALQGSFREHMALLQKIPGVDVVEVRTKEELESVAGLIIPGGESTTMALVAERWGLIPELQSFAKAGKPVWGTCAGMIFLAEAAEGELSRSTSTGPGYEPRRLQLGSNQRPGTHRRRCSRTGQKKGGQALLGGLDITVSRNFFGAQVRVQRATHTGQCRAPPHRHTHAHLRAPRLPAALPRATMPHMPLALACRVDLRNEAVLCHSCADQQLRDAAARA